MKSFAKEFAQMKKRDIEIFIKIKKELVPNCKHPKKMRDKTLNGQWYCMNCNSDL
jgi:mRNA-degrading endonuclease YafQ of YafQ-DinJ toxin-antitoxin module